MSDGALSPKWWSISRAMERCLTSDGVLFHKWWSVSQVMEQSDK